MACGLIYKVSQKNEYNDIVASHHGPVCFDDIKLLLYLNMFHVYSKTLDAFVIIIIIIIIIAALPVMRCPRELILSTMFIFIQLLNLLSLH